METTLKVLNGIVKNKNIKKVGRIGFEPTKQDATDLQSAAIDHSATFNLHFNRVSKNKKESTWKK